MEGPSAIFRKILNNICMICVSKVANPMFFTNTGVITYNVTPTVHLNDGSYIIVYTRLVHRTCENLSYVYQICPLTIRIF